MVVAPPNTNHPLTIQAPPIQLRDLRIRVGSCHEVILTVLTSDPDLAGRAVSADELNRMLAERGARYAHGTRLQDAPPHGPRGLVEWSRGRFGSPAPRA